MHDNKNERQLFNDPVPIRPRCPECEGRGTLNISYTWDEENVTCPKCEGSGTICWAEHLADLASDEIDEACNLGELAGVGA